MAYTLSAEDVKRCREISIGGRTLVMEIVKAVCESADIPIAEVLGVRRSQAIVDARWLIFYLAKENGHTVEAIGRAMKKDHSTVVHGIQQEKLRRARLESETPTV
jgi:chromosomal replication initiation ATPase DnaA